MSVPTIRKFRISLKAESAKGQPDGKGGKTQGLRTGDIVRRQYFDGKNIIYSLMCVLDYGVEEVEVDEAVLDANGDYVLVSQDPIEYKTTKVKKQQPWFVGALLEGDAPLPGEVLDFVRLTSLFDQSRSGALYLTASDDESPFMDVIDGIGRNCSLTWPENINSTAFDDPQSQYILDAVLCETEYIPSENDRRRICRIKKLTGGSASIKQTFSQYIQNPNQVLISFWAKASAERTIKVNLSYVDESRTDGEVNVKLGTDWKYYLIPITVDYSGRHRRAVNFNLSAIQTGEEFYVSDFNAILLSSVSNFGDASQIRVGKLTGVTDPVFGKLDSYGGYFQKLFATTSAHISGTLTAGDENGFAATFYAGKIHKNAFVNSLEPSSDSTPMTDAQLAGYELQNPTGVGQVFEVPRVISLAAQRNSWLKETDNVRIGKDYTFSFWAYCMCSGQLTILQNAQIVGTIQIPHSEILGWHRQKVTFKLLDAGTEDVVLSIAATYTPLTGNDVDSAEQQKFLFTAPQLESGAQATQYQPTDEIVTHLCEDYGAWFSRGGIGGTIQNPLLRLNADGEGAIEARSKSFRINQNGSGYLANHGIEWDKDGNVVFGTNVHLNWDNFDSETQQEIVSKSIRIVGPDTFTLLGDATGSTPTTDPSGITLTLEEENISSGVDNRKWQYLKGYEWIDFPEGQNNGKTLTIFPFNDSPNYWNDSNNLTVRCLVVMNKGTKKEKTYLDTFTIRKQFITGYTIEIVSSNGTGFKNNDCSTILTANVYYQGKLVDPTYCQKHFVFKWVKYDMIDGGMVEDKSFWGTPETSGYIDPTKQQVVIDYKISGSDYFTCEMMPSPDFSYDFPKYS